jgi:hypothetical protein
MKSKNHKDSEKSGMTQRKKCLWKWRDTHPRPADDHRIPARLCQRP